MQLGGLVFLLRFEIFVDFDYLKLVDYVILMFILYCILGELVGKYLLNIFYVLVVVIELDVDVLNLIIDFKGELVVKLVKDYLNFKFVICFMDYLKVIVCMFILCYVDYDGQ